MRIGFFTDTYYPFVSGVAKSIDTFGGYLASRGHEVHLVCPKTDKPRDHLGMHIHELPRFPSIVYPGLDLPLPLPRRIPKLDIVHTHTPLPAGLMGLFIAKKRGIPLVSTLHTLPNVAGWYLAENRRIYDIMESIVWGAAGWYYSLCDTVVTPSRAVERVLRGSGGYKGPVKVMPTGVDTNEFTPVPMKKARKTLGLPEDEKLFLHLGRVAKEKRIDVIISALGMLDDWRLLVAGTGPWLDRLREHARRVGVADRVDFLGFVPEEEKNLYYSSADAFVIASRFDTQGIVLLEAMACGCPVVASRAMALPEFVSHGENGLLFRYGSPRDLARVVREHENDLPKMRTRARRFAEKYSVEKMGDRLLELYEELVEKNKRSN